MTFMSPSCSVRRCFVKDVQKGIMGWGEVRQNVDSADNLEGESIKCGCLRHVIIQANLKLSVYTGG